MADLLTSIRAEIHARLDELRPAIAEYERLSTAAAALAREGRDAARPAQRSAPRPAQRSAPRPPQGSRTRPAQRSGPRPAPAPTSRRSPAKKATARRAARGARKREQTPTHSPTAQAILAALEHGSHTLAELVVVTALRASDIRGALRQLRTRREVVKTERDGRSAYALPS